MGMGLCHHQSHMEAAIQFIPQATTPHTTKDKRKAAPQPAFVWRTKWPVAAIVMVHYGVYSKSTVEGLKTKLAWCMHSDAISNENENSTEECHPTKQSPPIPANPHAIHEAGTLT